MTATASPEATAVSDAVAVVTNEQPAPSTPSTSAETVAVEASAASDAKSGPSHSNDLEKGTTSSLLPSPASPSTSSKLWAYIDPALDKLDDERLVTSHRISPEALMWIRIGIFVYSIHVIPMQLLTEKPRFVAPGIGNSEFLAYFTNLSWIGMEIYFLAAAYNSYVYIKNNYSAATLNARPKWLRWLNWNLYMLPAVYHYIVPLVFWSVLALPMFQKPNAAFIWFNVNMHLFDLFFMFFEFLYARVPLVYTQWTGFLAVSLLYLAYTHIYHLAYEPFVRDYPKEYPSGYWVYPFLDTTSKFAAVFYIGLIGLFIGFFFLVTWIHIVRDRKREQRGLKVVPGRKQV
ncbi:hypothetical protein HDU96_001784 [Phlyctochytrium bullatum]|nr:hypothetical protein HDU96_001784 [Phlyctochytrium bullatum]